MQANSRTLPRIVKYLLIAATLAAIVELNHIGMLNIELLLAKVRLHSDSIWIILALIVAQVVLYTFALTGSYALWLVAPVYAPPAATAILAIGGTLGAISAYYFSRKISDKWVRRIELSRAYRLIQSQRQFLILFALRVLPGFPHGIISYSAGILNCRPSQFITASLAGFVIKFYLYSTIVHKATDALSHKTSIELVSLSPLIVLSALSLVAVYVRHRFTTKAA